MCPIIVGLDVEFTDDIPVFQWGNGNTYLLGKPIVDFVLTTAVLQGLDVVDVGHVVAVGVFQGTYRTAATEYIVIEIIP